MHFCAAGYVERSAASDAPPQQYLRDPLWSSVTPTHIVAIVRQCVRGQPLSHVALTLGRVGVLHRQAHIGRPHQRGGDRQGPRDVRNGGGDTVCEQHQAGLDRRVTSEAEPAGRVNEVVSLKAPYLRGRGLTGQFGHFHLAVGSGALAAVQDEAVALLQS
mmetsp:Transcript_20341/g.60791  ORF Transcript_20341/g.60791 Transcript_20341/m.60791 type:complete len:160 (+) Transcript_20341:1-480(+)